MRLPVVTAALLLWMPVTVVGRQADGPGTPTAPASGAPGATNTMPQTDPAAQQGTATIRGRVVRSDSGQPLPRVRVSAEGAGPHAASTDEDGRYEITRLPAGSYQLSAAKGGFVRTYYGQRAHFRAGRRLALAGGEVLEQVDFAMPPGGVVAGRVVDEAGEPAIGAAVNVMRPGYLNGRRQLVSAGWDRTDDHGEFRIFDLAPGDYFVQASFNEPGELSGGALGYTPTYYPGTPSRGEAQPVTLGAGEEVAGIVFQLAQARTASISGVVRGSGGTPQPAVVVVRDIFDDNGPTSMGVTRPDGSFVVGNILPGTYAISASPMTSMIVDSGGLEVAVNGRDIGGLVVPISRSFTARGQVRFDTGARPADLEPGQVLVLPVSPDPRLHTSGTMPAPPRDDWTFELTRLAGHRLLRAAAIQGGWTLKSVRVDGVDVTDTPLDFTRGDVNGIEVLLTQQATDLSGSVTDDRGRTVGDATVVAFADDPEKWMPGTRFIQHVRLDQNGHYRLNGLPPGTYAVIALEDIEPGEETDPELLQQLRPQGTRVTLREAERRTLDLHVTAP